ncbi:hypothetical protein VTO73DRAFT_2194 [Trametes versicolor]
MTCLRAVLRRYPRRSVSLHTAAATRLYAYRVGHRLQEHRRALQGVQSRTSRPKYHLTAMLTIAMPVHSPTSTAFTTLHSSPTPDDEHNHETISAGGIHAIIPSAQTLSRLALSTSNSASGNTTVTRPARTGSFVGINAEGTPGHGHALFKVPSALHLLATSRVRTLARGKTLSTVTGAADAHVSTPPRRAETIAAAGLMTPLEENEEVHEEAEQEDSEGGGSSTAEAAADDSDEDVPPLDLA